MGNGNEAATTGFILLGLYSDSKNPEILICIILLTCVISVAGNTTLILLICLDPHLHTPMYILLSQLSLMDLTLTSSTVTKMVTDFSGKRNTSQIGCGTQMFFYLTVGIAECVLLTLMTYDCYVTICNPLRYLALMSPRVCLVMVIKSWMGSSRTSLSHTIYIMHVPTCGPREIHHFFCEVIAFLKLSCEDASIYEKVVLVTGYRCNNDPLLIWPHRGFLCPCLPHCPPHELSQGEEQSSSHLLIPPDCGESLFCSSHDWLHDPRYLSPQN
ncbi:olfactory receptor 2AE1-like [Choloepus didactylus]|uniref:olfactory receptor 2AE1-like n=1 Tax=Choloepus didactylus TaxID=27675 RepID=UPI00189CB829|nr:olfactory receptor 2AE1-like [Choloepus didactylus]